MRILAVDTSSCVASAAVLDGDRLVCECSLNHKKTHSQKLMPMIDYILTSCELSAADIDVFAVSVGPGSFTGLRIGVSTVKALAHAVGKPVVGVSTVEALAYNLAYCGYMLCPIMDARRNQVYNGLYRWQDDAFLELVPPRAVSLEDCLDEVSGEKTVFMGDGVPVYREQIKQRMGENALFAPPHSLYQRAGAVAQLAMHKAENGGAVSYLELAPVYLRKSQAEREYYEKMKGESR